MTSRGTSRPAASKRRQAPEAHARAPEGRRDEAFPSPPKLTKSYRNIPFLESRDARVIRILSEYLEPLWRFRRERVMNTIVFFGSSRARPRDVAAEQMENLRSEAKKAPKTDGQLSRKIKDAKVDLEMSRYYEDAVKLASMITNWSKRMERSKQFVVCSGGGPGIMEAANRGAAEAGGKSVSLGISLPFESPNIYHHPDLSFEFHYFFMRKFWFAYLAKVLVVFPGGFGTLDECMETLTLVQTKKLAKELPIVLYGSSYWKKVVNFDAMVAHRVLDPADLNLFTYCDTPKEAFDTIKKELRRLYP